MIKPLQIATGITAIILSACGGGSNNRSEDKTQSTTTLAKSKSLKIETINISQCGSESPNLNTQLILHNKDFSVKKTYRPNQDGTYAIDIEGDTATYTLFTVKEYPWATLKPFIEVRTYQDVSISDTSRIFANHIESDTCECETMDITLFNSDATEIPSAATLSWDGNISSSISGAIGEQEMSKTVCKDTETGDWPTLYGTLSFSDSMIYTGVKSDYNPVQTVNFAVESPVLNTLDIQVLGEESFDFNTSISGATEDHRRAYRYNPYNTPFSNFIEDMPFFTSPDITYNRVSISRLDLYTLFDAGLDDGSLETRSVRYFDQAPTDRAAFNTFNHLDYSNALLKFLDDDQYDFKQAFGADNIRVVAEVSDYDRDPLLRWLIFMPPKADLSILEDFDLEDDIIDLDIDASHREPIYLSMSIDMVDYKDITNYNELFVKKAKDGSLPSDYHAIYSEFELDYNSLDNLSNLNTLIDSTN